MQKVLWRTAILALVACCGFASALPAYADERAFSVAGGIEGVDYTYAGGILTVVGETPLTISMANAGAVSTDEGIVADPGDGKTAHITINDVHIERAPSHPGAACAVASGGLDLVIAGDNVLTSYGRYAGVQNDENPLAVSGEGSLFAEGGALGAGIGGGDGKNGANITIAGGTIKVIGGRSAAGIGGGLYASGTNITIAGGTLTAQGGEFAAGIGGGYGWGGAVGHGMDITISGGRVVATGGLRGAGIGGGYGGNGSNIAIEDGDVTAQGGEHGAGIGGANGGVGKHIAIVGGTVMATGGLWGAGIGGAFYGDGTDITVSGGTVTAQGGSEGAGIGGGVTGNGTDIIVESGTVTAAGGDYASAIGGGSGLDDNICPSPGGQGSNIAISGGFVTAAPGQTPDPDYAQGSVIRPRAQAIGSGYGSLSDGEAFLTGGFFADAARDWANNEVYALTPEPGYAAAENREEATKDAFPVRVLPEAALSLAADARHVYDGSEPGVSEVVSTARYGADDASGAVEFAYRASASAGWEPGLPKAAGSYRVRATIPEGTDADGALYAPASAEGDLIIDPATFSYRIDDRQVAAGSPLSDLEVQQTAQGVNGEQVKGSLAWYASPAHATPLATDWPFPGDVGETTTLFWCFTPDASETDYVSAPVCGKTAFAIVSSGRALRPLPESAGPLAKQLADTGDPTGPLVLAALACAGLSAIVLRRALRRR